MSAVNTMQKILLDGLDDVPPGPARYTQYVERTLHDRIQAAYRRGVDHGSRYRMGVLLAGMIIGWLVGVSLSTMA
jgi:hypothetical protein